ncbi:MAG: zinc ribbon domain-containing protein [Blastocatellia bacterium]|nr:zinc ribbon domain-containing protein [Blastocatellia bacterium]
MFCPRCGNQPSSDRVRFCPSCGFRLDGVGDLIARDGAPSGLTNITQMNALQCGETSERKNGVRRGAKLVFFSLAMFLPFFGICFLVDGPGPLFLPASIFLAGIFWMIYYRLFGDENAPAPKPVQPPYYGPPPQSASPLPPQSVPVYRSPVETPNEHSVVEHTTRSLERQE